MANDGNESLSKQPSDEEVGRAKYGTCPKCGAGVIERERRLFGNDRCANGHIYPSKDTLLRPELEADEATVARAATHLIAALHNAGIKATDAKLVLHKEPFGRLITHIHHGEAQDDMSIFGVRINGLLITSD